MLAIIFKHPTNFSFPFHSKDLTECLSHKMSKLIRNFCQVPWQKLWHFHVEVARLCLLTWSFPLCRQTVPHVGNIHQKYEPWHLSRQHICRRRKSLSKYIYFRYWIIIFIVNCEDTQVVFGGKCTFKEGPWPEPFCDHALLAAEAQVEPPLG